MRNSDARTMARQFAGLSDRARLQTLWTLARGECCVGELSKATGLRQPLMSFHLKALKAAQLVTAHRSGRRVYYRLARLPVCCLRQFLDGLALEREGE